jgi:F0F1-type ATP synthase membrane subunit b/b'
MLEKLSLKAKRNYLYLALVLVAFFALIWYFSKVLKTGPKPPTKEEIIKKQLEELEKLKTEAPPLTEEEYQKQIKELEELRKESKPLSQEEIQQQLEEFEELEKLRK